MKTRHSYSLFIVLLVSLLGATAIACPPPECPACNSWNGSSCVWSCGATGNCCGISGSRTCCSNECCERGTSCCTSSTAECCGFNDRCCDADCCMNTCCPSGQRCCGVGCCSNSRVCCGGTCCTPGYTCCGSNCCVSDCCSESHACCGNIGQVCCDGLTCYNSSTEKCCGNGNGTVCPNEKTCCGDFGCCLAGQCCNAGGCVDNCPSDKCCSNGTCVTSCPGSECCDDGQCVSECSGDNCCDGGTCEALEGCESCIDGVVEDDKEKCTGECNNCTDAQCHYDNALCDPGDVCVEGTCCDTASAGGCTVTAADIGYNPTDCDRNYAGAGQCTGGWGHHIAYGWIQTPTHQNANGPGTVDVAGCADVTYAQCVTVPECLDPKGYIWNCVLDFELGNITDNMGTHDECPSE